MSKAMHEGESGGATRGVVVGRAHSVQTIKSAAAEHPIVADSVDSELQRFEQAVHAVSGEYKEICEQLKRQGNTISLRIVEVHQMMLLDPELMASIRLFIRQDLCNSEWAIQRSIDHIIEIFDEVDDPYLHDRKVDIEQIGRRLISHLCDESVEAHLDEQVILVVDDISPIRVIRLWQEKTLAGFIMEKGGTNAHTMIVARSLGIPALAGARNILNHVRSGELIVLDADRHRWIANPEPELLAVYYGRVTHAGFEELSPAEKQPLYVESRHIPLMANLELEEELAPAFDAGAEGIGLCRTEFIFFCENTLPDEETQYRHYHSIAAGMLGAPVTFRILDIGYDKVLSFDSNASKQTDVLNPALGLRGVRLLLNHPELMFTQLRALVRVGKEFPLQLMIPMVGSCEEVLAVKKALNQCQYDLGFSIDAPLGCMIELPAAALIADELASVCDFFSIGTNDLIQYTLAADREDEQVANIYQSDHPAVWALIEMTVAAAKRAAIPVGVCGEIAGDAKHAIRLVNMGIDSLSMGLSRIQPIRKSLHHAFL
ncbi:MAG: phosphoenolpyruvate--protein phosphotransferase [Mariprofundaceae bacterium]